MRHETVNDLELSAGADTELRTWERDVTRVVDDILDGETEVLSRFRERIEDDREPMSKRFTAFKTHVGEEVGRLHWFRSIGAVPLAIALVVFAVIGALLGWQALDGWRSVYPRWNDVVCWPSRRARSSTRP